jgi:hypothetical protein
MGRMTQPRYDLDLTQVHFERPYGDITLFGTWFGKDRKPALCLVPTAKLGTEYITPCVVPMSQAWVWDEKDGDGAHCARVSCLFATNLGFGFDTMKIMKITSIIGDNIGDLINIPPKPTEAVVVADAIRTDQSGKQHHSEIIENV